MLRSASCAPVVLLLASALLSSCRDVAVVPHSDSNPGPTPTVQRTSLGEMPDIDAAAVLALLDRVEALEGALRETAKLGHSMDCAGWKSEPDDCDCALARARELLKGG